jgi:hypothetical protein
MTMMLKYRANVCVAVQVLEPSQFIKEIPHHLLNFQAIKWGQLPPEERALPQAEQQEHFQQQGSERSMGYATPTPKQIAYLHDLGCTVNPASRLHASLLIEQYIECATATPKQIAYLDSLGCTVNPTSRLHASRLIEQYGGSMGCGTATPKQIAYLHSLGCTVNPTSRLHASQLIEQYKTL